MQIAKLFAGLGFQVDTTGLVVFKKALAEARGEVTNMSRGTKTATRQLRNFKTTIDQVSKAMSKIKGAGASSTIGKSYQNIATNARRLDTALSSIATSQKRYTNAIGKINSSVAAGVPLWERYRASVVSTRIALRNINGDLNRLRANSRVDIRVNRRDSGSGGGAGGGSGGGFLGALGIRGFLSNMLPTAALGSIGAAIGYGSSEVIKASREQTKMENAILMTSEGADDFSDTMKFVSSEALRLGITSSELGKSFSQMNLSAKGMTKGEKKEMFTGFSEFMVALGTDETGQKGILKAFNQMFALNKIFQDEINQLSEHGIPATLLYDAAMKAHNLDSIEAVKKLQEDGGLIPELVLFELSKNMKALANDTGALAKMQSSSGFKQNVMKEKFKQSSKRIMDSGLDVQLGNLIGQLTEVIVSVEKIARSLELIVVSIGKIKEKLDSVSAGNGGGILAFLALLIFRFKALKRGAQRAFIVFQNGGRVTRMLGELFKGAFGRTLKVLITRFGGWLAVIWAVIKGLIYLGDQLQQKDLGNWTIFDTIALRSEHAILKVKSLIEELKWLQTYMTSGAMMDDSFDDVSAAVSNKAKNVMMPSAAMGVTQVMRVGAVIDKMINREGAAIKSISEYEGMTKAEASVSKGDVINIYSNKTGELIESHKVPATYNR